MRKKSGMTLAEALIALAILALLVPVSLGAFSTVFTSELRLHRRAEQIFLAEWWFNRLELPLSLSGLNAASRADERGRERFSWTAGQGEYGTLRVTLSVTDASGGVPYTESRVY